jgi:hypothetical protein
MERMGEQIDTHPTVLPANNDEDIMKVMWNSAIMSE